MADKTIFWYCAIMLLYANQWENDGPIYLFIYLFTYLFIYFFIYLFIYWPQ